VAVRCKSCGRLIADDNFFSECWRCAFGMRHRLAPYVWFALVAAVLAVLIYNFSVPPALDV